MRKYFLSALGLMLVLACTALALLVFGNPQWHKRIYMFQAFVYPKHIDGHIKPPANFSGTWNAWNEYGTKVAERNYQNGKLNGKETLWTAFGHKSAEREYRDGLLDGKETGWLDNQKKYEKHYKNGELDGAETYWGENGLVSAVNSFKSGKLHGTQITYFKNGNKRAEENYIEGKRDGKTTSWYENGQKEAEEFFKNRYRYGIWTYWKKDGTKDGETNWTARYDKGERAFAGPVNEDEIDAAMQSRPRRNEDNLPTVVISAQSLVQWYSEFKTLESDRNYPVVKLVKNMERSLGGATTGLVFAPLSFVVQNEIAGYFVGFSKTQTRTLKYTDIPYESILFVTTPIESFGKRVLVFLGSVSPQQSTIFSVDGELNVTLLYPSQMPVKYNDGDSTHLGAIRGIRVIEPGLFQLAERWNHHGVLAPTTERQFLVDVRRGKFEISAMPDEEKAQPRTKAISTSRRTG